GEGWASELDSFLTRRSSDLKVVEVPCDGHTYYKVSASDFKNHVLFEMLADSVARGDRSVCFFQPDQRTLAIGSEQQFQEMIRNRSEEHTSELQSPYDLVCRH